MFSTDQAKLLEFKQSFFSLLNKEENSSTKQELQNLLSSNSDYSANAVITTEISTSRNETISLQLSIASFAILNHKHEFFNTIIDKIPNLLFVNPFLAVQSQTHTGEKVVEYFFKAHETPLKLAVRMCNPVLVSTVLSNPHFTNSKVVDPTIHIAYVKSCKEFAESTYPAFHTSRRTLEQTQVLDMLDTAISR